MPLPARGGTTLSRLRRNAGKGGRALTPAHTHTPGRAARPPASTRLPPGAPRRAPNAEAERPRAARGPAARRMAPNCHPPARPRHSLARAARPSRRRMPLYSPYISPLLDPRTLAIQRHGLKAEGPREQTGKAPNSGTCWVSFPPDSPCNRPLNLSPVAILPPNTMCSSKKLNF